MVIIIVGIISARIMSMRITGPIKMIEALNMFNKALGVLEYISYIKSNQI